MAQIIARGAADYHLTAGATITYWRVTHSTHTNFATEIILQNLDNAAFAGLGSATLTRTGDLIHRQFIVLDLPGLYPAISAGLSTQSYAYVLDELAADGGGDYFPEVEAEAGLTNPLGGFYCHYTNAVGFAAIKKAQLAIGGTVIDTVIAEYLFMWDELSGRAGNRCQDMVGKFETREQLIAYSRKPQRLYVPLPFWYCQVAGNALSLVSLAFNNVQISVEFQSKEKLIVVSNADIAVFKSDVNGNATTNGISDSDLKACIMTEYVYLDVGERNRFAEGLFDQLIHAVQYVKYASSGVQILQLNLLFNHPVIELIFGCRLKANYTANKHFDFSRVGPANGSGKYTGTDVSKAFPTKVVLPPQTEGTFDALVTPETVSIGDSAYQTPSGTAPNVIADNGMYALSEVVTVNADPFDMIGLSVNGLQRFGDQKATFFRQVQPNMHHTSQPRSFVYCFSFALHPQSANPSGALNWSRVDNVVLSLTLHDDIKNSEVEVFVFGRNWNVFSYLDGVGGHRYL